MINQRTLKNVIRRRRRYPHGREVFMTLRPAAVNNGHHFPAHGSRSGGGSAGVRDECRHTGMNTTLEVDGGASRPSST